MLSPHNAGGSLPGRRIAPIAAAVAIVLAGCDGTTAPTEPAPLVLEGAGFSFRYPAAWDVVGSLEDADGRPADWTAVGRIDPAGNLVGAAVRTAPVEPPIPRGDERAYLEAAFSPETGLGPEAVVLSEEWATLAGTEARRYRIEHLARGERLEAEVVVAAAGATIVVIQCQAPGLDEVAAGCALVEESLVLEAGSGAAGPG